jgi:hypothetical protein
MSPCRSQAERTARSHAAREPQHVEQKQGEASTDQRQPHQTARKTAQGTNKTAGSTRKTNTEYEAHGRERDRDGGVPTTQQQSGVAIRKTRTPCRKTRDAVMGRASCASETEQRLNDSIPQARNGACKQATDKPNSKWLGRANNGAGTVWNRAAKQSATHTAPDEDQARDRRFVRHLELREEIQTEITSHTRAPKSAQAR